MASKIENNLDVTGDLAVGGGSVTQPRGPIISGGAGAISTTDKQNASLHMRTDANTLPECVHNSAAEKLGFGQHAVECRVGTVTANATTTFKTYAPRKLKVTGVSRAYAGVPASTLGTVLARVRNITDSAEILASTGESDEGLTNDVLAAHSLTGTASALLVDKGDLIQIDIISNNADMTGGTGCNYYIYYEDN